MGTKRLIRTLRIFSTLLSDNSKSAGDLAKDFEVSQRTIFRDLSVIRDAGLAVPSFGPVQAQTPPEAGSKEVKIPLVAALLQAMREGRNVVITHVERQKSPEHIEVSPRAVAASPHGLQLVAKPSRADHTRRYYLAHIVALRHKSEPSKTHAETSHELRGPMRPKVRK